MVISKKIEFYRIFQILILTLLYFVYIAEGYKSFYIWTQVDVLAGSNPLKTLGHPHGLRYLVTWPAISFADYFGWNRNQVFSYFVMFNMLLSAGLVSWVQSRITKSVERRWISWFYLYMPIFITLSFAMNGRLSYMLLGTSLMIFSYINWLKGILQDRPLYSTASYALLVMLSLALISVSSGCLTVGIVVVFLHSFVLACLPKRFIQRLIHSLLNLSILTFFIFLQYLFLLKNLNYYGGSLFAMLTHGPGMFIVMLNPDKSLLSLFLAVIIFLLILLGGQLGKAIKTHPMLITCILLVAVSLVIGIYGYSTMLTGTTAGLILISHIGGTILCPQESWQRIIKKYVRVNIQLNRLSYRRAAISAVISVLAFMAGMAVFPSDWSYLRNANKQENIQMKVEVMFHGKHYSVINGSISPKAMAFDGHGNQYIVDGNNRILRIQKQKNEYIVNVFAGDLTPGDKDGPLAGARFKGITHITTDSSGRLYISDSENNKVKMIDESGTVKTIAGNGSPGVPGKGCEAIKCFLKQPEHLLMLPDGNLLITLGSYQSIVRLDKDGKIYPYMQLVPMDGSTKPIIPAS